MDNLRKHALLSASGANKWLNCTPSARREEFMPEDESVYAEEGTIAHEMAEASVHMELEDIARVYAYAQSKGYDADEMLSAAQVYSDYIFDSFTPGSEIKTETRLLFGHIVPDGFGTCDALIMDRVAGTASVIDFKYGKGVKVSAKNNPQLILYALAILYKEPTISQVKLAIVQPRTSNIESVEMTRRELEEMGERFREKAKAAYNGEGVATPGEWCKFCKARGVCRERTEAVTGEMMVKERMKSDVLSSEELSHWLKAGELLTDWYEGVKKEASRRLMDGIEVPGYKMVEGRGSRIWTDEEEAIKRLKDNGIAEALLYDKKLKTLPQIEKAIGKKNMEGVGDLITKRPGAPTLVPDSDPRQALEVIDTRMICD